MKVPERLTAKWIDTLEDRELLDVEWGLHQLFARAEKEEKKVRGSAYALMRGPEPLLYAWQRWSLLNNATRARGLHPRLSR
jgi:hypothetical protein